MGPDKGTDPEGVLSRSLSLQNVTFFYIFVNSLGKNDSDEKDLAYLGGWYL